MENKNKRGISPLIATVLIIGFTIVLAALVITWGTNLFKGAQDRTSENAELSLACTEVLTSLDLTINNLDEAAGTFDLVMDNGAQRALKGFVLRVYNTDETSADTIDTAELTEDYTLEGNNLRTFPISYDTVLVENVVKIGVKPKVNIKGVEQQCQGEATKEILD